MLADMMCLCPECGMAFSSEGLMNKHWSNFCLERPSSELQNTGYAPREKKNIDTAESSRSWVLELERLKRRKEELRKDRDEREQRLLKKKTEEENEPKQWDTKSKELRQLQAQMANRVAKMEAVKEKTGQLPPISDRLSTNSSLSIQLPPSPDEEPVSRSAVEREHRQLQLRAQAENYNKNLTNYRLKTDTLTLQRQQLERRLVEIKQSETLSDNSRLLDQLTTQQDKNQLALMQLQQQTVALNQTRASMLNTDDALLAEINAMQAKYLQNGGKTPQILLQFADLEQEALDLQEKRSHLAQRDRQAKEKYRSIGEQLMALELENQRLQEELIQLHEDNTRKLQSEVPAADNVWPSDDTLTARREKQLLEMEELEQELELANQQVRLELLKQKLEQLEADKTRQQSATIDPTSSLASSLQTTPTPYDPNTGFMIFYDFLSGLDPRWTTVTLCVSIYNRAAQYSLPSVLPVVKTSASDLEYYQLGTVAVIGARHPVPSCPASKDLCLILELQALGEDGRMESKVWCRLELFNYAGWLTTGCWRLPFQQLPIIPTPCTNIASKRSNAEVFVRIVSHAQVDIQSAVTIAPANYRRYRYSS